MHNKAILIIFALLLLGGMAFMALGGLGGGPELPMQWNVDDELVLEDEFTDALTSDTEGSELGTDGLREALEGEAGEPNRVDAILRGRVVDTGNVPIAGARVLLSYQARGRRGRGQRGGGGNRRGVPEPVITDADGIFAFAGQVYQNLTVNLQITHKTHAPTLFDQPIEEASDLAFSSSTFMSASLCWMA